MKYGFLVMGQSNSNEHGSAATMVAVELVPHYFDGTRPDIFGSKCRVCGMLPGNKIHIGFSGHDPGDEDPAR